LVATRKEAQTVFYRAADERVERLLVLLQDLYCPELAGQKSSRSRPNA
jgi:ArsR family transcriptional regulator, virulence genes transcriptional regulator